jgi:hypothetical protein
MSEPVLEHVSDLKPDPRNARRHTSRNVGMIQDSIQRNGFGRSLLLASDGTIIAGNATVDAAVEAGIENVRVIESDGTEIIAIRRTDVAPGSEQFTRLALEDNRSAELSSWDAETLDELSKELDLLPYFYEDELEKATKLSNEYRPDLAPDSSEKIVTAEDMKATAERMGLRYQAGKMLEPITCPHCAETFYIDPANIALQGNKDVLFDPDVTG